MDIQHCCHCSTKNGLSKSASKRSSTIKTKITNDAWSTYRCNARSKGLEFEITKEDFIRFRNLPCRYCGKDGPSGMDRVDNGMGYIKTNIAPCCSQCNYAKRNQTEGEFLTWIARVYENQNIL